MATGSSTRRNWPRRWRRSRAGHRRREIAGCHRSRVLTRPVLRDAQFHRSLEYTRPVAPITMPILTRRSFLQAAVTAPFLSAPAALSLAAEARQPQSGMTLGFSTYAMKSLEPVAAIEAIAKIGFDAVEICCLSDFPTDPAKLDAAARASLRKAITDAGLRLPALMENLPLQADDKAHNAGLERMSKAAELAHALAPDSPPILETIVGGAAGKFDALRPMFLKRLADWAKLAERENLVIAIKPHRMSAMDSPAKAIGILKELGNPPSLRMVYDWSHYAHRDDLKDEQGKPATIEGTVKESLPFTVFVVAKDVDMVNGKAAFKLPGETGKTDHAAVIKALHAGGYRGDVNCEVSSQLWKQAGYDAVAAAKACYKGMAAAFEQAGVKRAKEPRTK